MIYYFKTNGCKKVGNAIEKMTGLARKVLCEMQRTDLRNCSKYNIIVKGKQENRSSHVPRPTRTRGEGHCKINAAGKTYFSTRKEEKFMKKNNVKKSVITAFAGVMAAGMMAAPAFADAPQTGANASSNQSAVVATGSNASASQAAATSGTKTYSTLSEAISGAEQGAVVTLNKDVTEDVTVPANVNITIDLNGHTLKNASGDTITVPATAKVTIKNGAIDNITSGKAAVFNNGTVSISNVKVTRSATTQIDVKGKDGKLEKHDANSYYAVVNHGTMTLDNATVSAPEMKESSLIENGYYNYTSGSARDGYVKGENAGEPSLTINSGTYTGGMYTVKNDDNGRVVLQGGTFSGSAQAPVLNWNKLIINGGTFTGTGTISTAIVRGTQAGDHDFGTVNIADGTFTADNLIADATTTGTQGEVNITGGDFTGIKNIKRDGKGVTKTGVNITGGKFSASTAVTPYVGKGVVKVTNSDGSVSLGAGQELVNQYKDKLDQAQKDLEKANADSKDLNDKLTKASADNKELTDKLAQAQAQLDQAAKDKTSSDAAVKAAQDALKKANAYIASSVAKTSIKNFRVAPKTKGHTVKASWNKNTDLDGYILYRSTKRGSGFKRVAVVKDSKSASATIKGQKKGKTYYYKMKGYKKVGKKNVYTKFTKNLRARAK